MSGGGTLVKREAKSLRFRNQRDRIYVLNVKLVLVDKAERESSTAQGIFTFLMAIYRNPEI